jgi:DNA (cytosine-5)-methyltransferase 1
MGYHRAGFEVVGVDHRPQPRYPFASLQADALAFVAAHGREFDAIHASPPCQRFTVMQRVRGRDHPDLIGLTRSALCHVARPHVIENVPGAPLDSPVMLCGAMFPGLRVYRHRLFESDYLWLAPPHARHRERFPRAGRGPNGNGWLSVAGHFTDAEAGRLAMGIDWMTRDELAQAIPPAYTEWVGRQLLRALEAAA